MPSLFVRYKKFQPTYSNPNIQTFISDVVEKLSKLPKLLFRDANDFWLLMTLALYTVLSSVFSSILAYRPCSRSAETQSRHSIADFILRYRYSVF